MVFINNLKFACESCIKGHRSSSCHHADRPLFEVKKKGRPVSQCERCRELRKTKKVHSKCECPSSQVPQLPKKQLSVKSKRFIPITPALPNGIKDAVASTSSSVLPDPRAQVTSLLNPCHCKDVWSCTCRNINIPGPFPATSTDDPANGLATLARAAALCCNQDFSVNQSGRVEPLNVQQTSEQASQSSLAVRQPGGCCGSRARSDVPRSKRSRRSPSHSPVPPRKQLRGPDLPPIRQLSLESEPSLPSAPPPKYPEIPPLSSVSSIAGSGCTCGFKCTCPGCLEHRGVEYVSKHFRDCQDGCGTCVDESTAELPSGSTAAGSSSSTPSFIDAFFARAATVPLPPIQRGQNLNIDPTNITVYPTNLFGSQSRHLEKRGAAFGLVQVPKLQCCAGKCGCSGGACGCGAECRGCCDNHEPVLRSPILEKATSTVTIPTSPKEDHASPVYPLRSCCANKKVSVTLTQ